MKKLYIVLLLSLFFLVACDRMSGDSYISCSNINPGLAGSGVGASVVTIKGYDEEIILWRLETTLTRAEFDQAFLDGMYLSDAEIHELFAIYNQSEVVGITFQVAELNHQSVVIAKIYDYEVMAATDLNRIWSVEDFEDSVTLSSAIAGLEDQGAVCEVMAVAEDE